MTVYRCVCPYCSAYIRSADDAFCDPEEFWDDWDAESDDWLESHVCGENVGNGIENHSEFARYEPDHVSG